MASDVPVSIAMLPVPRQAYYEWGDPPQRETFTVIGVGMTPAEKNEAADIYHSTWLLVIRSDGRATWLSLCLTFVEAAVRQEAASKAVAEVLDRLAAVFPTISSDPCSRVIDRFIASERPSEKETGR